MAKREEEKNDILELSEDKFQFLKRITEGNKIFVEERTQTGIQQVEKDLFFPFELGQLLSALNEEEEEGGSKKK